MTIFNHRISSTVELSLMNVQIVTFPCTKMAAIEHIGPPWLEHDTARLMVEWKLENRLLDQTRYRSYGLHYTDPRKVSPAEHRVEFCLSVDQDVSANPYGIYQKTIPDLRCALARDLGSRANNRAALYLCEEWLPTSGEEIAEFPIIFHYVNVGPNVKQHEAVTNVYLPLK